MKKGPSKRKPKAKRGVLNPKENKSDAQYLHAKKRAMERYGLDYTKEIEKRFVGKIHRGEAHYMGKQSNRVTYYIINHEEYGYAVVYDKLRKTIVTFLPLRDENLSD